MTTPSASVTTAAGTRWRSHRVAAWSVRAAIFLGPLAGAIATSLWLAPRLFVPSGALEVVAWWLILVTASSVVAWAIERMARRLLPLTTMLKMTLLFPDRAPSRFKLALRRSDLGELRRRVAAFRSGETTDPDGAAALLLSLADALNRYDPKLRGHGERTRAYADMLAEEMRIPPPDRDKLRWAALLHDIGKIDIPSEILAKDGPLDDSEKAIVRRHPLMGMRVAAPLVPWLGDWSRAIEDHHEWWDGTGYPRGLKGEEISLGARIVAVADAYDVMTGGRSYQPAKSPAAARREIAAMAGTQFDPAVARALLNVSLGRLRWMIGPMAWMGQIPFFLDRLGRDFVTVTSAAALTAATIVGADLGPNLQQAAGWTRIPSRTVVAEDGPPASLLPGGTEPTATDGGVGTLPTNTVPGGAAATTTSTTTSTVADPASTTTTSTPDTTSPPATATTTTTTFTTTTTTSPTTTLPPPSAHDDVASTPEDQPLGIDVLGNDSPGLNLAEVITAPSSGEATVESGHIRYSPAQNFNGTDTLRYRACDNRGRCDEATVAVRVSPVNDPPAARNDTATTRSGRSVTVPVLDNDRDVDGDELTVASVDAPAHGRTSTDGTTVSYVADSGFSGSDHFTYRVCDPSGACARATVDVEVEAVPRPPNAVDDTAYYHPGGKEGSIDVLSNDTHPDGLALGTVSVQRGLSNGDIVSIRGGVVTYRMDNGTTTADSFVYRVCDERGLCDTAAVTLLKGP